MSAQRPSSGNANRASPLCSWRARRASFSTASTGTLNLSVQDSSFLNNAASSVYLNPTGNTSNTYLIRNNSFTHATTGNGVTYEALRPSGSPSVDQGKIQNNTLSLSTGGNANPIDLAQRVAGSGRFEVSGNTITSYGLYGMQFRAMDGAARMDVILTNNAVSSPASNPAGLNLDGIALTKLDVLSELPEVRVCVAYRTPSGETRDFPIDDLARAEPVYESFPGWGNVERARSLADLPASARAYVDLVLNACVVDLAQIDPAHAEKLYETVVELNPALDIRKVVIPCTPEGELHLLAPEIGRAHV